MSEPEALDRPRSGDHQARIDGHGFAGKCSIKDESSVFTQRSEDFGGRLSADGVDGVSNTLPPVMRRTCSSIGPSADEMTASPPAS